MSKKQLPFGITTNVMTLSKKASNLPEVTSVTGMSIVTWHNICFFRHLPDSPWCTWHGSTNLLCLPADGWCKTAQTHVTTTWPNEPRVSVASEAHGPRTRLSHAHICSSFLYNVFLHPELYNYFLFYTFSKLHLWWVWVSRKRVRGKIRGSHRDSLSSVVRAWLGLALRALAWLWRAWAF